MKTLFNLIKSVAPYLFGLWIIIIIVFSSLPRLPDIRINTGRLEVELDKIMHFLEYFALAFLALLTFTKTETSLKTKRVLVLILCLLIFAALDESHQLLIAARSFSIYDMFADFAGVITGTLFTLWLNRIWMPRT